MAAAEPRLLHQHSVDVEFSVDDDMEPLWNEETLRQVATSIVASELEPGHYALALHLVGEPAIADLNREHRARDVPTDVLSFGLYDPNGMRFASPPDVPILLGDVVVCLPRARSQAEEYGHSLEREIAYLVAHGTLHILGYDHEQDEASRLRMREREEAALAPLGLTRAEQ